MVKNQIKTINRYNWAWQYFDQETDNWIQFDCNDCLVLEFGYKAYTLMGKKKYQQVELC